MSTDTAVVRIDRRLFLLGSLLGGVTFPEALRAQQRPMPVVGMLGSATEEEWRPRLAGFRTGLIEQDFVEGANVTIAYRWAGGRNELLPGLAAELVALPVDVIAVIGNAPSIVAAKRATSTIPIVFRAAVDPVAAGFAASMSRPGGNITGVTTLGADLGTKHFELLRSLLPAARQLALLVNPTNTVIAPIEEKKLSEVAISLGVQLHVARASTNAEIASAFEVMARNEVKGLIVTPDSFFNSRNNLIASLSLGLSLPTITPYREFVEAGGLLSYGGNINEGARQAGMYVGRILKGAKVGEMPIVQAAKLELVINARTAKRLGVTIPSTLQILADEVIE